MHADLEVPAAGKACCATGKPIPPGETFFSVAELERGVVVRRDFAAEAWAGPGESAVAWWKCRAADAASTKPALAPQDVLLNLFAELADQPAELEFRYVLGLLLMRRRLVRQIETRHDGAGAVWIHLECPSRKEHFEMVAVEPTPEQAAQLEARLVATLYAEA